MKYKLQVIMVFCVLVVFATKASSQMDRASANATPSAASITLKMQHGDKRSPKAMVGDVKKHLSLGVKNTFQQRRVQKDHLGFTHTRYEQRYQGIPVAGGEVVVHESQSGTAKITGKVFKDIKLDTVPVLTKQQALQVVLQLFPSQEYAWESAKLAEFMKKTGKGAKTLEPRPELVIVKYAEPKDYRLAYVMDIVSEKPYFGYAVYIDAHTGQFLNKESIIYEAVQATGDTLYDGPQNFYTTYGVSLGRYQLFDDENNIVTYYDWTLPTDPDNVWNDPDQRKLASAQWGGYQTYKYFQEKLARNSYDDNGSQMILLLDSTLRATAAWSKDEAYIRLGTGGTRDSGDSCGSDDPEASDWLVTLDTIAHEWTHGITQSTANLKYSFESGALNESFSDIFGTAVEYYSGPGDYNLLEDVWIPGSRIRSMSNPKSKEHPDTYLGQYWYSGYDHNGCVHVNSGVQNHWFFLLAEGGAGVNDNNDWYTVLGIGRDKAEQIAYRNLTVYLSAHSNYHDAREYSIEAAKDLYGDDSFEVIQVTNAWYAVGVGQRYSGSVFRTETESNNTNTTADGPTNKNTYFKAQIETSSAVDWYYFDVHASGNITITAYGAYKSWTLYDGSSNIITTGSTSYTPHGYKGETTHYISGLGRYYLKFSGSTGDYYFNVAGNLKPAAFFEVEANDAYSTANGPIPAGKPVSGIIGTSSDYDWYYFDAVNAGTINLTLNGYYKGWSLYKTPTSAAIASGSGGSTNVSLPAAGRYYVRINGNIGRYDYAITGNLVPAVYEIEGNDSQAMANDIIESGVSVGGKINPTSSDNDWYRVEIPQATSVSITLNGGYKRLVVYDASGTQLFSMSTGTSQYNFNAAGKYYVRIDGLTGIYDFKLTE